MGEMFKACKGKVVTVGDSSVGLYAVNPKIGSDKDDGKVIINQIDVGSKQVVDPVSTLGDDRILYTFGDGWGDMRINGTILLGTVSQLKLVCLL